VAARAGGKRAIWLGLAGLLLVAAVLLAVVFATGSGSGAGGAATTARTPFVRTIPQGANPHQQARNIAAWIRSYAARPK
jgi:ABC-type transporter Mla subunit MlaD